MKICTQCQNQVDEDSTEEPFICSNCKKNNVIHIKLNINENSTVDEITYELTKIFDSILFSDNIAPLERDPCPQCHMTLQELKDIGRFGCETCYQHYFPEFLAIAQSCQDGIEHVGKVPKVKKYAPTTLEDKIKYLRLLKAKAAEMENFPEAARLAEELRLLTN